MKTYKIYDDIYEVVYTVILFSTKKEQDELKKRYGLHKAYHEHEDINGLTLACFNGTNETILIFNAAHMIEPAIILKLVAHETFHAATLSLSIRAGFDLNDETQEPYAYYFDNLFVHVLNCVTGVTKPARIKKKVKSKVKKGKK